MEHPTVVVRDVVRGGLYELDPAEVALRVAYDLFHPAGAVLVEGDHAEWIEGEAVHVSRVAEAALGEVTPGERVLVRVGLGDEWWLCDVEAVEGVAGNV
jgi:hypothetical protein